MGLGQPLYDRLDADIAYAMMGLNAVKGVEIGAGFASVAQRGTAHGDSADAPRAFAATTRAACWAASAPGQDLEVSIAIKPTSSILSPRESIDVHGASTEVDHQGPPRPLRGHPRRADCRGAAGAGGDGPRAAPPRAVRRCAPGRDPFLRQLRKKELLALVDGGFRIENHLKSMHNKRKQLLF